MDGKVATIDDAHSQSGSKGTDGTGQAFSESHAVQPPGGLPANDNPFSGTDVMENAKDLALRALAKLPLNVLDLQGTVENFLDRQPVFYDRSGLWWLWDSSRKCWVLVDEVDVQNAIAGTVESSRNGGARLTQNHIRTEIFTILRQLARSRGPKKAKKTWVQFSDVIVDAETGERFKSTPEWFVVNPLPWRFGASEETPIIDKLMEEWVGSEKSGLLREISAYCLLPDYPIHRIFALHGAGRNGKGCFLRFLINLVGMDNCCSTELESLAENRFESSKLFRKLVCTMGETNVGLLKQTSRIKRLSGQDLIGFEFKNKTPFSDFNYAKILIATNSLPQTTDKTEGFYRRWTIIDFPNKFKEGKDVVETIPQEEYENFCRRAVGLLRAVLSEGKFTNDETVEERMERYEKTSNPLSQFISQECVADPSGRLPLWELHERYTTFARESGKRVLSKSELKEVFLDLGYDVKKEYWDNELQRAYFCFFGIRWKGSGAAKLSDNSDDSDGIPLPPTHIGQSGHPSESSESSGNTLFTTFRELSKADGGTVVRLQLEDTLRLRGFPTPEDLIDHEIRMGGLLEVRPGVLREVV